MKKLILIVIAFSMFLSCAHAENLSEMSVDDLVALRNAINAELAGRPEWKQVTVPAGTWVVGKDIPAGEYSVSSATDDLARFTCTDSEGGQVEYIWLSESKYLGRIELIEGYTVELTAPVIFAPPVALDF